MNPLWTVLLLFGLFSVPRPSSAQSGIAMNASFAERSAELTLSTATSGAVGGVWLDKPIAAELSLSAPRDFGTMRWLPSRGSMPTNAQTLEFAEARPLNPGFMDRSDLLAIRQSQPTKLKKISRKKAIIIAAVVVPIAILVFYQIGLKGGLR